MSYIYDSVAVNSLFGVRTNTEYSAELFGLITVARMIIHTHDINNKVTSVKIRL